MAFRQQCVLLRVQVASYLASTCILRVILANYDCELVLSCVLRVILANYDCELVLSCVLWVVLASRELVLVPDIRLRLASS